jgi:hypothetical protein
VPLDGGLGDAGQLPGASLGLAPAEEPEDFYPALDTRVGVLVAFGREGAAVGVTEDKGGSGGHLWLRTGLRSGLRTWNAKALKNKEVTTGWLWFSQ